MIIIPDIHGRTFWKDAVKQARDDEQVIFLGDYMDPYPHEEISFEQTTSNLKEIISYKKENMDKCVFLLGNHDTEYLYGTRQVRCDFAGFDNIKRIFTENKDLFKIAHYISTEDKLLTFSHSFISKGWVKDSFGEYLTIYDVIDKLNNMHERGETRELRRILDVYSWRRGGPAWEWCGSPIWADLADLDFIDRKPIIEFENVTQYFGHTQLRKDKPLILDGYVDLDCRRAFRFNVDTNEISTI